MFDDFVDKLKKFLNARVIFVAFLFLILFAILFRKVFVMQIVEGDEVASVQEYKNTIERGIKSTRGLIFDRNGYLLAENVLKYSVVMSNTALITTNAERNKMIYKLITTLESYGNELEVSFPIALNERGEFEFNVNETAELRFKLNVYGRSSINNLTDEERRASAEEVFYYLRDDNLRNFKISDEYTVEEALKIMTIRYTLLVQNPQYTQFVLSSEVGVETVSAIKENMADMPGVEIRQQTYRVYYDAFYFAHIVGYTGLITSAEMDALNEEALGNGKKSLYELDDHVGKKGIEKSMEDYLAGSKGSEVLTANNVWKVLDSTIVEEPQKGNDIYLTIDRDLQISTYHILERNIAAILISKINNGYSYGTKNTKAAGILIPIYEVYNALISNNVIDIKHFKKDVATDLEKKVLGYFEEKRASILDKLRTMLVFDSKVTIRSAGEEMGDYLDYVYQLMQDEGEDNLVIRDKVNTSDQKYKDYRNSKISFSEYLQYCISESWINKETLGIGEEWYTVEETYDMLIDYLFMLLLDDKAFEKKIYETLIFTRKLTGREICLLLFDQGVIEYDESDYKRLLNSRVSAYDFMMTKLKNLEITPAQLALEPCSGSIVINDVNTGEVLAMVSYPSYDNDMFANKIVDVGYYNLLLEDRSLPLLNKPSQYLTACGSTFKPLSAFIGLGERLITTTTRIQDKGEFDLVEPSPRCWIYPGSHGFINATQALTHSCNYFFYDLGYRMSLTSSGIYEDRRGTQKIQEYAGMFGLDSKSGIEVEEYAPDISNGDAVRSMIGYYHNLAPIHLSRYISTIATNGTCLDLTLVHDIMNGESSVKPAGPRVHNQVTMFTKGEWEAVQKGMYGVVNSSSLSRLYKTLPVTVAGKTGTAQVSTSKPHHALFVSYAPYENPEIAVTISIPNGYASANAAYIGREVYGLYFSGENKEELLSGNVHAGTATDINISD